MKDFPLSASDACAAYSRKREVPRYTFVAVTEIVEHASQACILAKTIQISRKGCYVDIPTPLPVGTALNIVISRDQGSFTTKGRVIYVHEGSGMGIIFLDPTGDELETLNHWLAEHPRNTDAV